MRLFLALWLALFAVQTSELIAVVSPDGCVESSAGAPGDACPDACTRCICCARVAVVILDISPAGTPVPVTRALVPAPSHLAPDPCPRGILHVPRHS